MTGIICAIEKILNAISYNPTSVFVVNFDSNNEFILQNIILTAPIITKILPL